MNVKKLFEILALILLVAVLAALMCFRLLFVRDEKAAAQATPAAETAAPTPEPTAEPTPEATPSPTPEPTPEPTEDPLAGLPHIDIDSWEYTLVNHWNSIGEYAPELEMIENNQQFDTRAADPLREFIAAARAEGLSVFLSSTYRTYADQQYLYNRKVAQYGEDAAWKIVSVPGTSEHQLGLAADITDQYYELKDSSLANTALYQWMSQHCQEYGFIVRYPEDKQDITGVIYEPWHFRYVGAEAAAYIMENKLCLEEFVSLYKEIHTADNPG